MLHSSAARANATDPVRIVASRSRVLVVNAGSSTLKMRLLDGDDGVIGSHDIDPWTGATDDTVLALLDAWLRGTDAIGHRVVHGGAQFDDAVLIDDDVVGQLERLSSLAPLHQPRAVAAIRAARSVRPGIPAVACFDTTFHTSMPPAAATYALPRHWSERWDLRRYGFHGLSHSYAVRRAAEILDLPLAELRIVSCHLGAGASLCAVAGGRSLDTTMGFTPLEGLVMATRSGSIDPGLVLWLVREAGLDADEVLDGLERSSGLAGLSGTSGDMRSVVKARSNGDEPSRIAFDVYIHRLRREVAGMVAALGGLDALVFTGGVGEHEPVVRMATADGLLFLGIALDSQSNVGTTGDGEISAIGSAVRTVVVTAREDIEIARQVRRVLA